MTNETSVNARDCPGCGMPREDWPDGDPGGFAKGDAVYCCRGCAEGSGCTCDGGQIDSGQRAPTKDELRDDRASGDFVQSLQRETKTVDDDDYGTPVTNQPSSPPTAAND
jgi:hypothetical protein